ncbi:MAG TPA: hypothetical protein VM537_26540 [Anaerolineae bacterium]|nr:hypothetical protein [Anaerolineae bacterium]
MDAVLLNLWLARKVVGALFVVAVVVSVWLFVGELGRSLHGRGG